MAVRSFNTEKDLEKVLDLYRMPGAPRFARDRDFILHFMDFPGVEAEGILVCEDREAITGLAIVAIGETGDGLKKGEIIELSYRDLHCLEMLLGKAGSYAGERGADYLAAKPAPATEANQTFRDWVRIDTGVTMVKLAALEPLVRALAENSKLLKKETGRREVVLTAGEETVLISASRGEVSVEIVAEILTDTDCVIRTTAGTFLEIVTGNMHPLKAYLRRRLIISSLKSVPFAIRLLMDFRIRTPYIAIADML